MTLASDSETEICRINGKIIKEEYSNMKHKTLAQAMVAAQANVGAAKKNAANPHFRSKFADLGSVIEAVKEAFNNEGISITQPLETEVHSSSDGKPVIVQTICTTLRHESGECISSSALVPTILDIQKQCAAITYMRRFALQSMLLIPADDKDGEDVVDRGGKTAKTVEKSASPSKPKPSFLKK